MKSIHVAIIVSLVILLAFLWATVVCICEGNIPGSIFYGLFTFLYLTILFLIK